MELKGKKIAFLGDSITEGFGATDWSRTRYDSVLLREEELAAALNYGIGGTRIAHQIHAGEAAQYDLCFCGRSYMMARDVDAVVVFGGTNDYGHGDAPFGDYTDTTPATFLGGVNYLMNFLKTAYPNAVIVFMTPARRTDDERTDLNPHHKGMNLSLKSYVDGILACGEHHNIPVLDLYRTLPIDPNDPEDKAAYTTDGLHLNDAGHSLVAHRLADFLKSL